jgi:23S rRNA (adenine2503-C2)-methyltransferase
MDACRNYLKYTGRRITFEWALIQNINDSNDQADKLGKLINGMNCHVNIIPLNSTTNFNGKKSSANQVIEFKKTLEKYKIPCTVRVKRGVDIQAGCGQLASENPQ